MHLSAGFVGVCFRQRLAASRNESQYECRWSTFYWPRAAVPSTVVNGTPGRAPQSLHPKSPPLPLPPLPPSFPGWHFPAAPAGSPVCRLAGVAVRPAQAGPHRPRPEADPDASAPSQAVPVARRCTALVPPARGNSGAGPSPPLQGDPRLPPFPGQPDHTLGGSGRLTVHQHSANRLRWRATRIVSEETIFFVRGSLHPGDAQALSLSGFCKDPGGGRCGLAGKKVAGWLE